MKSNNEAPYYFFGHPKIGSQGSRVSGQKCKPEGVPFELCRTDGMVQVGVTPTDSGRELVEFRLQAVRSGFRLKAAIF